MKRNCPKCYTVLKNTPKRTVNLVGATVTVLGVSCPGCGRTYDDDYDVQPVTHDPVAGRERRLERQRASKQRYLNKLRDAARALRGSRLP